VFLGSLRDSLKHKRDPVKAWATSYKSAQLKRQLALFVSAKKKYVVHLPHNDKRTKMPDASTSDCGGGGIANT
jgi:hypothetical protein